MKGGRLQAKDIADGPILDFLANTTGWAVRYGPPASFANSVMNAMPEGTPEKVALAKMASMIRRGLVAGCACGCRGDVRLP